MRGWVGRLNCVTLPENDWGGLQSCVTERASQCSYCGLISRRALRPNFGLLRPQMTSEVKSNVPMTFSVKSYPKWTSLDISRVLHVDVHREQTDRQTYIHKYVLDKLYTKLSYNGKKKRLGVFQKVWHHIWGWFQLCDGVWQGVGGPKNALEKYDIIYEQPHGSI